MSDACAKVPLVRLGELLVDSCYGTSKRSGATGATAVLGITNIRDGRVRLTDTSRVSLGEAERRKLALRPGDILVTRTSSYDLVGQSALVVNETESVFASYLVRLRVDESRIDPAYLNHWLNSPGGRQQVRRMATRAVNQANVNPTQLRRQVYVPLPPIRDQRRIARVLAACDQCVEKTNGLVGAKVAQRAWLSRQLIDQPASSGEWPLVKLGGICRPITRKNCDVAGHVLTSSARLGLVDQLDYFNKDVSGADLSGYYLLRRGEFAYNRSTSDGYPYGVINRLDGYDEGVLSTLNICFELVDDRVSSDFLYRVFESGIMNRELGEICQVGSRAHGLLNVTKSDFFSLPIALPSLAEQTGVVAALASADREIEILRKLVDAYARQKQSLMTALLSPIEGGS